MVKKILILLMFLSACTLVSCDNSFMHECDHCGDIKTVSYQLIDGIDLVVCDECYKEYLQGEWNLKTNTDKSCNGHRYTTDTSTIFELPTLNLPKRMKEWGWIK